jgi:hypothetical protein
VVDVKCERGSWGEVYKVSINFIWRRQELSGSSEQLLIIKYGTLGQAVRDHGRFRGRRGAEGKGKAAESEERERRERVAAVQSWVKGRKEG